MIPSLGRGWLALAGPDGYGKSSGPIIEKGVENLLLNFADSEILEAAQSIPERDLLVREDSGRHLAAYVGDTTVDIDFEQQTIIHRCPIWAQSISEKKLCPHVARVFLMVESEKARSVLSLIHASLANWKFDSKLSRVAQVVRRSQ
jgi:hypothetical protein